MPEENNILKKLDGLEARFEEVSTLITDPDVISDQQRYVKLTKEYKDLGDIMNARKRYINCLATISEAKDILANETDPEMKEMARMELSENEELQPKLEEEIKLYLFLKIQKMTKTCKWKSEQEQAETKLHCSLAIFSICTNDTATRKAGHYL